MPYALLRALRVLAFLLVPVIGGACRDSARAPLGGLSGATLQTPLPRPQFTLTATDGQPFDFHQRTQGKVTLLFFGYTNCPDVCPIHAANVAAVLREMSWGERQKIDFVFVTTDPERDSLPAIRAWLDHFDPTFIGLHGTRDEVDAVQRKFGIGIIPIGEKRDDGSYDVGHFSGVFAFEADDSARVVYPFGIRQEQWARDIPILLARSAR
jgi:protein SCO1/2